MDSFCKFKRKKLPCKADFYSLLTDEDISDDDYNHAKDVWNTFGIKNMGEYHDLYLKSDVVLLADVFENFREAFQANYRLDLCHYVTSPGLAWDAMLRMTGINLDLITDIDMQLFIEKGMRGGISYIAHLHAVANNKYMENYNGKTKSHNKIPTLYDKEKYVLHEQNLKLYLSLGLRLKEMHRALQFSEKPWLKK